MKKNILKSLVLGLTVIGCVTSFGEVKANAEIANYAFNQSIQVNKQIFKSSIIEELKEYNVLVVNDITKIAGFEEKPDSIKGVIDYDRDMILVLDTADKEHVFRHEVGHMIDTPDDDFGRYSQTDEFYDCFDSEAEDAPIDNYTKNSEREYFAEMFAYYIDSKYDCGKSKDKADEVFEECPQTYYYLEEVYNNVQ